MLKVIGGEQEGEFKAVASGTLPNGKPVVVNADGTVSVAAETSYSESLSSATVFNTNNNIRLAAAFDSVNNKVIIAYYDYGTTSGQAIVGTVSGDTISFGTQVQFSNNVDVDITISVDTANDKVVIFYRDPDNSNYGTAKVGTISGTSISFGTAVVFSSYYAQYNSSAYDSTSGKVIVANRDGSVTDDGRAYVGTVSGTSISFGSAQTFQSGNTNRVGLIYDASVDRIVVVYISGATTKSRVGTVSGTSISFGTEQTLGGSNPGSLNIAGDNNGTVFVGYTEGGASDPLYAFLATIGTSSITKGTTVGVDSYVPGFDVVYDSAFDKWVVLYRVNTPSNAGKYRVGSGSGTTLTFETAVTYYNNNAEDVEVVFDSNSNKVVFAYRDSGDGGKGKARVFQNAGSLTNLTAENYIGMSRGVVVAGETGAKTTFDSNTLGNEITGSVYDPDTQKIIICYTYSASPYYGYAVVGTVSGTTLTFGTPAVFQSGETSWTGITYDTTNNKVVVVSRNASNSYYGMAAVGTVSGTSISFGTPVVYNSANSEFNKATFDENAGKVVVTYRDNVNADGEARVGTVSGTSISFGTPATFDSGNANYIVPVYDANAQKVVIAYRDNNDNNYGKAIVGTVSGTSISFGTAATFSASSTEDTNIAYDSTNNKVIVAWKDGGDSDKGKAALGTVSGTSISFGTAATINNASTSNPRVVYDVSKQKAVFFYATGGAYYVTASISGTDLTDISSSFTLDTSTVGVTNFVYHPIEEVSIAGFKQTGGQAIAFSLENRGSVADTAPASLDIIGSVSTNQSGLTAGEKYYVQTDGTLSTTAGDPSVLAGTAISATKLVVKT